MASKDLKTLAEKMKQVDFCIMTTQDGRGVLHGRPMSNNREVEFDGETYFFTRESSGCVKQLEQSPIVSLAYQTDDMLFIHVYGSGHLIRQKGRMEEHWNEELSAWFEQGIDTPDLVMIRVEAKHIRYWHKEEEGEISF